MRQAERITLFVQDRDGTLDPEPDLTVIQALLRQPALISKNADGSRTFIFDLAVPGREVHGLPDLDTLRELGEALRLTARELGLPLTAALAESAELVAEAEALQRATPPRQPS
jgi:hypothetical protein